LLICIATLTLLHLLICEVQLTHVHSIQALQQSA